MSQSRDPLVRLIGASESRYQAHMDAVEDERGYGRALARALIHCIVAAGIVIGMIILGAAITPPVPVLVWQALAAGFVCWVGLRLIWWAYR